MPDSLLSSPRLLLRLLLGLNQSLPASTSSRHLPSSPAAPSVTSQVTEAICSHLKKLRVSFSLQGWGVRGITDAPKWSTPPPEDTWNSGIRLCPVLPQVPAWGPPRLNSHSQMPLLVVLGTWEGAATQWLPRDMAALRKGLVLLDSSPIQEENLRSSLPFGSALPRYLVNGSYSPSSAALSQPSLEGSPAPFPGFPCAPWPQPLTTSLPTSFYCASPFSLQVLILT